MKEITYKCNLCGGRYSGKIDTLKDQVKAIYFKNNTEFDIRDLPTDCSIHICSICIEQLKTNLCNI